ncbi:MAG: rRNA pseudouridine synthase [Clostridiales bacterium]|nr:rRNA pseudouridine synthase [Clostridiales bacterium]
MRLDRLLATLALGSRAQVKELIRQGRVQVNGALAGDPGQRIAPQDEVRVDGQVLDTRTRRHLMMNKPAGVLTAARDRRQPTVMDLLPPMYISCGCMPIGRLDKDTEGLLLFTTDGQAAHRLLAPQNKVPKAYWARVSGRLTEQAVQRFAQGIQLSDFTALPAQLTILSASEDESLAEAVVYEGKYHQVKRMFGACGHEVQALRRLRFGALALDEALAPGQCRELSDAEWQSLLEEADGHA